MFNYFRRYKKYICHFIILITVCSYMNFTKVYVAIL